MIDCVVNKLCDHKEGKINPFWLETIAHKSVCLGAQSVESNKCHNRITRSREKGHQNNQRKRLFRLMLVSCAKVKIYVLINCTLKLYRLGNEDKHWEKNICDANENKVSSDSEKSSEKKTLKDVINFCFSKNSTWTTTNWFEWTCQLNNFLLASIFSTRTALGLSEKKEYGKSICLLHTFVTSK